MTAKTEAGALAIEARRGDAYRAQIRAEGWRAGYAAALEAVAKRIRPWAPRPPHDTEAATAWSVQTECADVVRSLPLPEMPGNG